MQNKSFFFIVILFFIKFILYIYSDLFIGLYNNFIKFIVMHYIIVTELRWTT